VSLRKRVIMRPNKPGHWWYKTNDGKHVIQYVDFDIEQKLLCYPQLCAISAIENAPWFFRWIGPAHPPKKVKSFECRHGRTTYCDSRKAVLLDDVKEYLLGDDDNG
jgi:hypothetical protein